MRKQRQKDKRIKIERKNRELRERMRISKVISGLGDNLSIKDLHFKTGLSQKNIRKIMMENSDEITFLLLKRQIGKEK